jgi:uncharacterized protein
MVGAGKYKIDLLKVKEADVYNFEIDSAFFSAFEESTIKNGEIDIKVEIERTGNNFPTIIEGEGTVKLECDRCLRTIDFPTKSRLELIVKLSETQKEDEDEIVYVPAGEAVFHMAQHIYDMVYLSLPIRKTCEEANIPKGCDPKVIEKLNSRDDDDNNADPRWEKLKDLLE